MKKLILLTSFFTMILLVGCISEEADQGDLNENKFNGVTLLNNNANLRNKNNQRPQPPIWADCMGYTGIVTPATFKPNSDSFDELYALPEGHSFAEGKPLISDSKPGDQDYNGGRWHLNVLKDDVNPTKYADACSEEDLDTNDFHSTDNYFGCPLLPFEK